MIRTWMLALSLLAPQDTAEEFYKFKPGTCWVYEMVEDGKSRKMTLTVTKHDGAKVFLESVEERREGGEPKKETLFWSVEEGFLTISEVKGEKSSPIFRVYKLGSKKGDTWKAPLIEGGADAVHLGTGEIEVPAGKYKDVVHVRLTQLVNVEEKEMKFTADFHLAPKVGLVKLEIGTSHGKTVIQLKEPPK